MSRNKFFLYVIACLIALAGTSSQAQKFAGSETCKHCHVSIYQQYLKSGHPYKLQKINGAAPSFPDQTSPGVPNPPEGTQWSDISYIVGGFGWKARFLDRQGYIFTGDNKQYNLANSKHGKGAHWVSYGTEDSPPKPYTCGACHTTGWVPTGKAGPHQDGLPGIHGTWSEPGVTCEACHGPSAGHVAAPTQVKPSIEERCGTCHSRGEVTSIDADGGLIKHHEQYEDLLASPHKNMACTSCHDPHRSTRYQERNEAAVKSCRSCHSQVQVKLEAKKEMPCYSCHMPFAVKSAVSSKTEFKGGAVNTGDLRTHIQGISTDPDWKMFTDDGKFVRVDEQGRAKITLNHACMSCHVDKDIDWAHRHARGIH